MDSTQQTFVPRATGGFVKDGMAERSVGAVAGEAGARASYPLLTERVRWEGVTFRS
jgi:hypothetical protein